MIVVEERRGGLVGARGQLARKGCAGRVAARRCGKRAIVTTLISLAFLTVTGYLSRCIAGTQRPPKVIGRGARTRPAAGRNTARNSKQTVARRTAELQQSNTLLKRKLKRPHPPPSPPCASTIALLNVRHQRAPRSCWVRSTKMPHHPGAGTDRQNTLRCQAACSLCFVTTNPSGHTPSRVRFEMVRGRHRSGPSTIAYCRKST